MSGCRGEASEVLDDPTAEDGGGQGAPVNAGRQVERVDLDEEQYERLDEDLKANSDELEAVEQNNGLLPKTTSKTSRKEMQKYVAFSSFVGITSDMVLTRKGEW